MLQSKEGLKKISETIFNYTWTENILKKKITKCMIIYLCKILNITLTCMYILVCLFYSFWILLYTKKNSTEYAKKLH